MPRPEARQAASQGQAHSLGRLRVWARATPRAAACCAQEWGGRETSGAADSAEPQRLEGVRVVVGAAVLPPLFFVALAVGAVERDQREEAEEEEDERQEDGEDGQLALEPIAEPRLLRDRHRQLEPTPQLHHRECVAHSRAGVGRTPPRPAAVGGNRLRLPPLGSLRALLHGSDRRKPILDGLEPLRDTIGGRRGRSVRAHIEGLRRHRRRESHWRDSPRPRNRRWRGRCSLPRAPEPDAAGELRAAAARLPQSGERLHAGEENDEAEGEDCDGREGEEAQGRTVLHLADVLQRQVDVYARRRVGGAPLVDQDDVVGRVDDLLRLQHPEDEEGEEHDGELDVRVVDARLPDARARLRGEVDHAHDDGGEDHRLALDPLAPPLLPRRVRPLEASHVRVHLEGDEGDDRRHKRVGEPLPTPDRKHGEPEGAREELLEEDSGEEHVEQDRDEVAAVPLRDEDAHRVLHPVLRRPEVLAVALVAPEDLVEDEAPRAAEEHADEDGGGGGVDQPKLVEHAVDQQREGARGEQRCDLAAALSALDDLRGGVIAVAEVLHGGVDDPELALSDHEGEEVDDDDEGDEGEDEVDGEGQQLALAVLDPVHARVVDREAVPVLQDALLDAERELAVEDVVRQQVRLKVVDGAVPVAEAGVERAVLEDGDEVPVRVRKALVHLDLDSDRARLWPDVLGLPLPPAQEAAGEVVAEPREARQPAPPLVLRPVAQPVHRLAVAPHEVELALVLPEHARQVLQVRARRLEHIGDIRSEVGGAETKRTSGFTQVGEGRSPRPPARRQRVTAMKASCAPAL
mmetsp:Transcript_16346/g.49543  ORF Transcript_16346/g.49543 Transcript_16346/m.49543 type:complete len:803 (-) Transcript_16346:118-2526(-)